MVALIISYLFNILSWLIIINVILSWVVRDPYNKIVRLISQITEPIINPFRKFTYRFTYSTGLDFAPMIALIVLSLLRSVIIRLIYIY